MKRVSFTAALLLGMFAICRPIGAAAATGDAVKPGRWEFTSRLQLPAAAQLPVGTQPGGPGTGASHTMCVEPDKAVPTDPRPECKTERMTHNGGTISWTTACATPRGAVRSEGTARYQGDAMQASLTTHLPQPDGRMIDTHQRITGRYLGPCVK